MGEEFEPLESDVLTADLDVAREKIRTLEQERDAALARVAEVERECRNSDGYILWSRTISAISRVLRGESVAVVFSEPVGAAMIDGPPGPREICQEIEGLRSEVGRLKALLRHFEFSGRDAVDGGAECDFCKALPHSKHSPGCELAAALK